MKDSYVDVRIRMFMGGGVVALLRGHILSSLAATRTTLECTCFDGSSYAWGWFLKRRFWSLLWIVRTCTWRTYGNIIRVLLQYDMLCVLRTRS